MLIKKLTVKIFYEIYLCTKKKNYKSFSAQQKNVINVRKKKKCIKFQIHRIFLNDGSQFPTLAATRDRWYNIRSGPKRESEGGRRLSVIFKTNTEITQEYENTYKVLSDLFYLFATPNWYSRNQPLD